MRLHGLSPSPRIRLRASLVVWALVVQPEGAAPAPAAGAAIVAVRVSATQAVMP
ncbi:MAG: hypothetical protein AB7P03_21595 [Kofleriaceae bacterium]